jgi:hypothetical protein
MCEKEPVGYAARSIFQMEYVPRFTKQSRVPHANLGLAMTALFMFDLPVGQRTSPVGARDCTGHTRASLQRLWSRFLDDDVRVPLPRD